MSDPLAVRRIVPEQSSAEINHEPGDCESSRSPCLGDGLGLTTPARGLAWCTESRTAQGCAGLGTEQVDVLRLAFHQAVCNQRVAAGQCEPMTGRGGQRNARNLGLERGLERVDAHRQDCGTCGPAPRLRRVGWRCSQAARTTRGRYRVGQSCTRVSRSSHALRSSTVEASSRTSRYTSWRK